MRGITKMCRGARRMCATRLGCSTCTQWVCSQGSFRPAHEICAFRTVMRHRASLVEAASQHVQHMQKALDQMNVQIHRVLSDITGVSGLAILDAILAGERDPRRLAELRDGRVKASEESIVAALEGTTGPNTCLHLQAIAGELSALPEADRRLRPANPRAIGSVGWEKRRHASRLRARKNMRTRSDEDLRKEFFRIVGRGSDGNSRHQCGNGRGLARRGGSGSVALPIRAARSPIGWVFARTIPLPEARSNPARPKNVTIALAGALRMAAESLCRDKSYLGQFYRRMKMQFDGGAEAITAAAHKLARIIFAMMTRRVEYDETHFARNRTTEPRSSPSAIHQTGPEVRLSS